MYVSNNCDWVATSPNALKVMEINSPEHVQDYLTHLATRYNLYFGKLHGEI